MAINHWVRIESSFKASISNDGKYVAYILDNQPFKGRTLVVQSTKDSWKQEFINAEHGFFAATSKEYIFKSGDTLNFLLLGKNQRKTVANISSYQKSIDKLTGAPTGKWLAWQKKNSPGELVVFNLLNDKEMRYDDVISFSFNSDNNALLLNTSRVVDGKTVNSLRLVALPLFKVTEVWSSSESNLTLLSYTADDAGNQVAFMLDRNRGNEGKADSELWYYQVGTKEAIKKADNQTAGIDAGLFIGGSPSFSNNGKYILFSLVQSDNPAPHPGYIKLDVWSYSDNLLQSAQSFLTQPKKYDAAIGIVSNKISRLQYDYERVYSPEANGFAIYTMRNSFGGDRFWEKVIRNWLVSLKDGSRRLLDSVDNGFLFSPSGRYLIYYSNGKYYSYDVISNNKIIISGDSAGRFAYVNDFIVPRTMDENPVGVMGWLAEDGGVLVYDNSDIWRLDIHGRIPPVCLTGEYGRLHNIRLRLADHGRKVYTEDDTLMLTAYDPQKKENGFFKLLLKRKGRLIPLTMGPYVYDHTGWRLIEVGPGSDDGMHPIKATLANIWMVKRQSATAEPNLYVTQDFKIFKPLTNLNQHKNYNWLTAELITFRQKDGSTSQGVLYKPENFDSTKKYPVIFNYYTQMSNRLYEFPTPRFIQHNIQVPWFVSRGYLVFTPDIYFQHRFGSTGPGAYNAVVGAAEYLSKLSYVDARRMGINGHSVGGGLTNYIITHSNLFAAAMEGAGVSDKISSALQFQLDEGVSRLEVEESVIGHSLWDQQDIWLSRSPILEVNKISTPLLIFHCKKDAAVPWEQGLELFVALRRLGKKAWMLQYDDGDHAVYEKDAEDFTIRVTQFFDHFLKGMPPPIWMTEGIPARLKGVRTGLELDTSGRKP